ncbi:hypothetical protein AB2B38_012115 [Balneola sp. MJW-20]|uniref:hypothetical protein n=1 Tax=Gracilimonas aurantiaca TaxID=3234185 RepID=UPI0034678BB3
MIKKWVLFLIPVFLTSSVHAQVSEFGMSNRSEIEMTRTAAGTESNALILFEVGELFFTEDLELAIEHHVRFKLFEANDDLMDPFTVTYNPQVGQYLDEIKAAVHLVNKAGRTESVYLTDGVINETDIGNGLKQIDFDIEGIKPGSVFEFSYTLVYGHPANAPDWIIQRDIPVLYNELNFLQDAYFRYDIRLIGNKVQVQSDKEFYSNFGRGTLYTWRSGNIPALGDPSYAYSRENFRTRIQFLLKKIQIPDAIEEDFGRTWGEIYEGLLTDYYFAGQLLQDPVISRKSQELAGQTKTSKSAAQSIYDFVSDSVMWDNTYSLKTDFRVRESLNGNPASSAAVNLLLNRMLRDLDIKADPVLISTRDHGYMFKADASLKQFNHLIVRAEMDDQVYYLDATEGKRPLSLTPLKDMNGLGLHFKEDTLEWVDVEALSTSDIRLSLTGNMESGGSVKGFISGKITGYETLNITLNSDWLRSMFSTEKGGQEIVMESDTLSISRDQNSFPGISFTTDTVLVRNIPVTTRNDTLLFDPLMVFRDISNSFSAAGRKYPVEYDYPFSRVFNADIILPSGYSIAALPDPVTLRLPSGKGRLIMITQDLGDRISYLMQLEISNYYFSVSEFPLLREVYRLIGDTKNSMVKLIKSP